MISQSRKERKERTLCTLSPKGASLAAPFTFWFNPVWLRLYWVNINLDSSVGSTYLAHRRFTMDRSPEWPGSNRSDSFAFAS